MFGLVAAALVSRPAIAQERKGLPLEEILKVQIWTASRKEETAVQTAAAVSVITQEDIRRRSGASFLGRWQREISADSDLQFQAYYDYSQCDIPDTFGERRHTLDFVFQHRFPFATRHDVVWGVGYDVTSDDVENTYTIFWDPSSRTINGNWELAVVGQNVLDNQHPEFGPAGPLRAEVEQGVYGKVTWRF